MYNVDVSSVILKSRPEDLELPVSSLDHCEHVVRTALKGHPQLAADHLLNTEMRGKLVTVLEGIIRQLNLEFIKSRPIEGESEESQIRKIQTRQRSYEVLIEIALNLIGIEGLRVGFSKDEMEASLRRIMYTLEKWESLEKNEGAKTTVAKAVIDKMLLDMDRVMQGKGMIAKMGEEIRQGLVEGRWASSFLKAADKVIKGNVYYQMVTKGMCKFGNDYAIGLRWLRHLGYVQVSTNPVLAAIAYNDNPELWMEFKKVAANRKEWADNPEKYGDEITMQATMVALWPNLEVFRPIALLSDFYDGMVSYQLNPNVAASYEASVKDALQIYSKAEEFLKKFDAYLTWGYSNIKERGRPNIVFKVAGGYPAAIDITTTLNSMGIGTNNTVTYTVVQETMLIMAAMKGMAEALKKGIKPTQVYETNMGGRLESHLRDVEAEKLLKQALTKVKDKEGFLQKLAESLGASEELSKNISFEEKVRIVSGYKYLKKLTEPAFVEAIASAGTVGKNKEETLSFLKRLEEDIEMAGTLVAQRVYHIFFSPENRSKWLLYLQREYELTREEAEEIMNKIDVLPASKRKPADTLLTLADRNMTNTEFPNHQWNVLKTSREEGFNLEDYRNSIMRKADPEVVQRLLRLEDFRRAYELTPEVVKVLREVGIEGDFGEGGLKVEEWPKFGSVIKTMNQFRNAYEEFKVKAIEAVKEVFKK